MFSFLSKDEIEKLKEEDEKKVSQISQERSDNCFEQQDEEDYSSINSAR